MMVMGGCSNLAGRALKVRRTTGRTTQHAPLACHGWSVWPIHHPLATSSPGPELDTHTALALALVISLLNWNGSFFSTARLPNLAQPTTPPFVRPSLWHIVLCQGLRRHSHRLSLRFHNHFASHALQHHCSRSCRRASSCAELAERVRHLESSPSTRDFRLAPPYRAVESCIPNPAFECHAHGTRASLSFTINGRALCVSDYCFLCATSALDLVVSSRRASDALASFKLTSFPAENSTLSLNIFNRLDTHTHSLHFSAFFCLSRALPSFGTVYLDHAIDTGLGSYNNLPPH